MNGGPGNGRRLTILDLRVTYEIGGPGKTIIETFNAIDRQRFDLHLAVFARRDESDDTPFVPSCEKTGEALIKCQTKDSFVRSPENDGKCSGQKLPSRAYLAMSYGYAPSCYSFDGDKTLTPGELMCCRYP